MSRDFDNIAKEVIKNNKEIHKVDDKLSKELFSMDKDIQTLKKDLKNIGDKVDTILDLLNSLVIVMEDAQEIQDEDDLDEYESNEGWLPEINSWEDNYEDNDENEQD